MTLRRSSPEPNSVRTQRAASRETDVSNSCQSPLSARINLKRVSKTVVRCCGLRFPPHCSDPLGCLDGIALHNEADARLGLQRLSHHGNRAEHEQGFLTTPQHLQVPCRSPIQTVELLLAPPAMVCCWSPLSYRLAITASALHKKTSV